MNNQEPELNPVLAETESAKTDESVQISRPEIPADKHPSYLRSRQVPILIQFYDLTAIDSSSQERIAEPGGEGGGGELMHYSIVMGNQVAVAPWSVGSGWFACSSKKSAWHGNPGRQHARLN
jgi:hypothetical protein